MAIMDRLQKAIGSSLYSLKELLLGIFGLFIVMGWVPIVLGGLVAGPLLGYWVLAEIILVLGFFGWVALQMVVSWWMTRG
jgi:hypothetical protein